MSLRVDCRDAAAYGELVLTASGSGYTSNTITVKIPKDDNGNKIADCWRNDGTVNNGLGYGRDDDKDTGPNTTTGDNITVINEYRGYYANGSWTDTDPNAWDVFVKLDPTLVDEGCSIGDAYALPMNVHEAPWVSMGDGVVYPHEIAKESGGTVPSVYAIRVAGDGTSVYDPMTGEYLGSYLGSSPIGPPWNSSAATIWYNRLGYYMGADFANDATLKVDYLNAVIAHEIGHSVNLDHCPCFDDLNCQMWAVPDSVFHLVTAFANHHNDDYDLIFDGYAWPRIPNYYLPDRIYIPGVGIRERKAEDVNADGVVSASDLVVVANNFGTGVPNIANVNGDGSVDILDLVRVANAIPNTSRVCFTSLREDVNADGVVNISDLVMVASKKASLEADPGHSGYRNAVPEDVNADGWVNEEDLKLVAEAFGTTVATSESVSVPSSSSPETTSAPAAPVTSTGLSCLTPQNNSAGDTCEFKVIAETDYEAVDWSVTNPQGYYNYLEQDYGGGTAGTEATLSYTFPLDITGTYTFKALVWIGAYSDPINYTVEYTIDVVVEY